MDDSQDQLQLGLEDAPTENAGTAPPPADMPLPPYDPTWVDGLPADRSAVVIDSLPALVGLAHDLGQAPHFAFDCETTGFDPCAHRLVGISISLELGRAFYVPIGHRVGEQVPPGAAAAALRPVFTGLQGLKIAHNAAFDLRFLCRFLGIDPAAVCPLFDTMIASTLTSWDERHGLKELARAQFGTDMTTYGELVSGQGVRRAVTVDVLPIPLVARYACADADAALRLLSVMEARIAALGMERLFHEVEMPLLPVVVSMEDAGLPIDVPYLRRLNADLANEIESAAQEVYRLAGERFTLDSPAQVARVLFEKLGLPAGRRGKSAPSTDAAVLERLAADHPVAAALLTYRELTKVRSTYVDPMLSGVGSDGRLRPRYRQVGAVTGRFSCTDPNLQSVPKDAESRIRRAVAAPEGRVLIRADYSQIELRVLAHFSQDSALLAAFEAGEDVHRRTAAQMFHVDPEAVTSEQREHAKRVNFGLIYGMSAASLARSLGVPEDEGARYYEAYFDGYPGVRAYLGSVVAEARRTGYVTTLLGRRRPLPMLHSDDPSERGRAERQAKNTPIQGSAADIIKIAMIRLFGRLRGTSGRIILQVHDELLVECDEAESERVAETVRWAMEERPMPEFRCPLAADPVIGRTWSA